MSASYGCPVPGCEVKGTLQEVRPHVVHTSDPEHEDLSSDDVVELGDENGNEDSEDPNEDENGDIDPEEPGSDDANPGGETPESSSSSTLNDDIDKNGDSDMDELDRQRQKMSDSSTSNDGSKTSGGSSSTSSTTPDDDPQDGLPISMPALDTTTLIALTGLAIVVVVGYLYLRDDEDDETIETVETGDPVDEQDEIDTDSVTADDLEASGGDGGLV